MFRWNGWLADPEAEEAFGWPILATLARVGVVFASLFHGGVRQPPYSRRYSWKTFRAPPPGAPYAVSACGAFDFASCVATNSRSKPIRENQLDKAGNPIRNKIALRRFCTFRTSSWHGFPTAARVPSAAGST